MQNPTETIRAAHNMTIELSPDSWRLVNGTTDPNRPGVQLALVEARVNGITCSPAFTRARQLPNEGRLLPADVARVVVGWAPESQNWHLGLWMAARPEVGFKPRWCGLASWPSSTIEDYGTAAKTAGQSLSRLINRPFHLVPAPEVPRLPVQPETQPIQATGRLEPIVTSEDVIVTPVIKPQEPPFEFNDWQFLPYGGGLVWKRRTRWMLVAGLRALSLAVVSVLFLGLAIGSQTTRLADVDPNWLPDIGLVVAGLLFLVALANTWRFVSASDVLIDMRRREVRQRSRLGGFTRWRVPFDSIHYLLVSQTPARPLGRKGKDQPMRTTQEVWMHVYDGKRFYPLADIGRSDGLCYNWENARRFLKVQGRRALNLAEYDTPAHHAALLLARTLGKDIWHDVR